MLTHYYKKLLDVKEPNEILKKIKDIRRIETNTTDISVRKKLYKIKQSKKEKVSEFCDFFNDIFLLLPIPIYQYHYQR